MLLNLLVVGIIVSIYVIRFSVRKDVGNDNSQYVASALNAIQIQIMNAFYTFLARELTEHENHRYVLHNLNIIYYKVFSLF